MAPRPKAPLAVRSAEAPVDFTLQVPEPLSVEPTVTSNHGRVVVLVDPFSTGVMLQHRLFETGYRIIVVWSDRSQPASREKHFLRSGHPKEDFEAVIVHEVGNLAGTVAKILEVTHDITAVMCGSEYGVVLEDAIADGLNEALKTNRFSPSGLTNSMLKVDKHLQANTIRQAGLDAVREKLALCEEDVRQFLEEQASESEGLQVVLKPQTGAGSVGVTFCGSKEEVWTTYHNILAGEHKAQYGDKYRHYTHAGVLMQEYLAGTEYIVNAVVLNGVIKTTAMFKYDKRPYNGGSFVCFSKELLVMGDDPQLDEVQAYAEKVLQAVGFRSGAIHAEIMYVAGRGPVLVEINCRLHGGNGQWVHPAEVCVGYNQLSVFMDAYLHEGKYIFEHIPARPEKALQYCHQVKMRTRLQGKMKGLVESQMDRIRALPSYLEHFFTVQPGDKLLPTRDMPSVPGEVTLVHPNREVLAADYEALNDILHEGIFEVYE